MNIEQAEKVYAAGNAVLGCLYYAEKLPSCPILLLAELWVIMAELDKATASHRLEDLRVSVEV